MNKTSFKVVGGLALMAVSSFAMASVVNTKHNLGATHPVGVDGNHTNATTEICIFCHTPHGGDQDTFAPLWNRATGTATYLRFSSLGRLTFDAKEAPIAGSVSAACLSCHDGTQSIDSVINSPGSDSTGIADESEGSLTQITTGTGGFSQSNIMSDGFASADGHWSGTLLPRGDMVYLGTDLSNDHPISMQYAGGGLNQSTPTGPTTDPDFAQTAANSNAGSAAVGSKGGLWDATTHLPITLTAASPSNAATNNTTGAVNGSGSGLVMHDGSSGTDRWWVSTTNGSTFTSQDFPLYSRTDVTGSANVQPTVECGTCHDPHSGNPTFLRLKDGNAGSQVCLTCHAK